MSEITLATTILPSQTSLDNLIRVANYDYGTAACANPTQIPSYCP